MAVKTKEEKKAHLRFCVGCGASRPKGELMRLVRNLHNGVELDKTGKINARGCYICYDLLCYEKALKKNAFIRALKVNKLPSQLRDRIADEIILRRSGI